MGSPNDDLTKTDEWFRTKLHDTIHYGIAAITIIAGWLLSNDSIISIHHAEDAEKKEAAIVLAILLPLAWAYGSCCCANCMPSCRRIPPSSRKRTSTSSPLACCCSSSSSGASSPM